MRPPGGITCVRGSGAFTRRTRTSATFVPTDISGLQLWLKADGTLWQDSARTTSVTTDADPVGAWDDESGNGNHVLQATSTKRPLYKTAIVNSLPVVRFDGSDDFLRKTFGAALTQPNWIFLVAKTAASTTDQGKLIDGAGAAARNLIDESGGAWRIYAGSSVLTGGTPNDNFNVFSAVFNGASSELRVNAASAITGNPGAHTLGGVTVGADDAGLTPLNGDVAEVLVYNASLTSTDRDNVEAYLNGRYAIY